MKKIISVFMLAIVMVSCTKQAPNIVKLPIPPKTFSLEGNWYISLYLKDATQSLIPNYLTSSNNLPGMLIDSDKKTVYTLTQASKGTYYISIQNKPSWVLDFNQSTVNYNFLEMYPINYTPSQQFSFIPVDGMNNVFYIRAVNNKFGYLSAPSQKGNRYFNLSFNQLDLGLNELWTLEK